MVERVEKVTEVVQTDQAAPTKRVTEIEEQSVSGATLAYRIVWFIAGAILVLLTFRLVLTALGANPANDFVNFIYTTSYPFVAPFFGMFGYTNEYGVSRLEGYTVIAMMVYLVLAWGIGRLIMIGQPRR